MKDQLYISKKVCNQPDTFSGVVTNTYQDDMACFWSVCADLLTLVRGYFSGQWIVYAIQIS